MGNHAATCNFVNRAHFVTAFRAQTRNFRASIEREGSCFALLTKRDMARTDEGTDSCKLSNHTHNSFTFRCTLFGFTVI